MLIHHLLLAAVLALVAGARAEAATSPLQLADLRSFFHGEPPAPPKAPPPKQLARVSVAVEGARDPQVEDFMRALAECIKAREGKPMRARLAAQYRIDANPDAGRAADLFVQAVERIPGPSEIVIQSVERAEAQRTARVELRYPTAPARTKVFRFDTAGRLLWSDLFTLRVETHGS